MAMSVPPPVVVALGSCPAHVQRLDARALPAAKSAVLSALPRLRIHGARVVDFRLTHPQGDIQPAKHCAAISRSALVHLLRPKDRDASLSGNPTFYVARTRTAWVIWFQAH